MPTLNSDGSINTSTDGQWDITDDEYYYHVCGRIAASMMFSRRAKTQDGTPVRMTDDVLISSASLSRVGIPAGLTVCMQLANHFGRVAGLSPQTKDMTYPDSYIKRNLYDRPQVPTDYVVYYDLVNTSSNFIYFDEIALELQQSDNWASRVDTDCQPFRGHVTAARFVPNETNFTAYEPDIQRVNAWFTDTLRTDAGDQFITLHAQHRIALGAHSYIRLAELQLHVEPITVYLNGITPVQMSLNYFGKEFTILGTTGQGAMQRFNSYATVDTDRLPVYQHCKIAICAGARWYEKWSEEHPGTYWTYAPIGTQQPDIVEFTEEVQVAERVTLTVLVDNTGTEPQDATLQISTYDGVYAYTVPAGFSGLLDIQLDSPAQATETPDEPVNITTSYTIAISSPAAEQPSATLIAKQVKPDQSIPVVPSVFRRHEEQLVFADSVYLSLAGSPAPDVEDTLTLTDDTFINHITPAPEPAANDILVISDDAFANQITPYTGDTIDRLNLNDDTYVTV